jgi:ABC-type Mn2+/Zn2+ transport system ATPase subunit
MTDETIIQLDNISKSYLNKKVLHEITLHFKRGTFYTLIGKNGVGKSTLMRLIMRSEFPDMEQGRIFNIPP